MNHQEVSITLTHDQALVLFEFLARWENSGSLEIVHPSEEVALSSVLAQLEKSLADPFDPNYQTILNAARSRLASSPESSQQ